MVKDFMPTISAEQMAAYIDGNLSSIEVREIDQIIDKGTDLQEVLNLSDIIDQDIETFVHDEFVYDSELSILESSNLEIPVVESDSIAENYSDGFSTDESSVQEKQQTQTEPFSHVVTDEFNSDSFNDSSLEEKSSFTDYEEEVVENTDSPLVDDSLQLNVFFHDS